MDPVVQKIVSQCQQQIANATKNLSHAQQAAVCFGISLYCTERVDELAPVDEMPAGDVDERAEDDEDEFGDADHDETDDGTEDDDSDAV